MKRPNTVGVTVPAVTTGEGTALMVHHLGLAAAYFEATKEDEGRDAKELIRYNLEGGAADAALDWVDFMVEAYRALEGEG